MVDGSRSENLGLNYFPNIKFYHNINCWYKILIFGIVLLSMYVTWGETCKFEQLFHSVPNSIFHELKV